MALERPVREYASVEQWARGLREQWGGDPLADEPDRLGSVQAFCEFIEKDPDELLAFCFLRRRSTGERFASVKRRKAVSDQIAEFRGAGGSPADEARRVQSHILSFLIHNGVQMFPAVG